MLKRLESLTLIHSLLGLLVILTLSVPAVGQVGTKTQVGEMIKRVEDGTDEFKDYLERRGDDARRRASQSEGKTRRRDRSEESKQARREIAESNKDELEEAVEDLEGATDRLRRRFRRVKNYLDTKNQVENVVDEGRRINQIVVRGNYGSEIARVWAVLRVAINDLARVYNVTPLKI